MRTERVSQRAFLNQDGFHGNAAVTWYVHGQDAGMTISDCSRTINLELGFYDESNFHNALFKARTLRAAAEGLEKALIRKGRSLGHTIPTRKAQVG